MLSPEPLTTVPTRNSPKGTIVEVELGPGEATVLIVGSPSAWEGIAVAPGLHRGDGAELSPTWSVATASATEYPVFTAWRDLDELRPLSDPDLLPRFSGTALYTASFDSERVGDAHLLDLGAVFELATVRLNGVDLGTRIAPPYEFEVPDGVLEARNTLEVEVTNTLAKAQPDFFSAFAQQDPTGLLGPVTIAPVVRRVPR